MSRFPSAPTTVMYNNMHLPMWLRGHQGLITYSSSYDITMFDRQWVHVKCAPLMTFPAEASKGNMTTGLLLQSHQKLLAQALETLLPFRWSPRLRKHDANVAC